VVEAEIHAMAGRSEAASASWDEALKANPNDPAVLSHVAAGQRSAGSSIKMLRRCLQLMATSPTCQRGIVQVHVEEGNVERARALVDSWREAGLGVGLLADWVGLEAGDLSIRPGAPEAADPDRAGRGLTRYLDALSQKGRGARQSGLEAAIGELEASASAWDHRLAAHVEREKERLVVPPGK